MPENNLTPWDVQSRHIFSEDGPFQALYAGQGGGRGYVMQKAYTLKTRCGSDTYIKRDGTVGTAGKGALVGEDVSFTLAASQDQTLIATNASEYIVRRLTPTECERLQGFPDGWTDIPYKGKEHPPDGPRYKALGNSMAVPVMRWIGERIEQVERLQGS